MRLLDWLRELMKLELRKFSLTTILWNKLPRINRCINRRFSRVGWCGLATTTAWRCSQSTVKQKRAKPSLAFLALLNQLMKIDKLEIPKMFWRAYFIFGRLSRSYHKSATPDFLTGNEVRARRGCHFWNWRPSAGVKSHHKLFNLVRDYTILLPIQDGDAWWALPSDIRQQSLRNRRVRNFVLIRYDYPSNDRVKILYLEDGGGRSRISDILSGVAFFNSKISTLKSKIDWRSLSS